MIRTWTRRIVGAMVGTSMELSPELLQRYPVLQEARWRRGGLPLRIGGWLLGQPTVAGITLWRTVLLDDPERATPRLLLHELAHVRQYRKAKSFPIRYLWESFAHGYARNRFELEADQFAEEVLWSGTQRRP